MKVASDKWGQRKEIPFDLIKEIAEKLKNIPKKKRSKQRRIRPATFLVPTKIVGNSGQ